MDLKKVSSFENMVRPEGAGSPQGKTVSNGAGPSFQEMLNQVSKPTQQPSVNQTGIAADIAKMMPQAPTGAPEGLKFSNHAIERMQSRGISFNKEDMSKLNDAVGRAAAKGSKDTLVLMKDAALIVSVKNKTVVTVMDQQALKENVFTNIDSTIVM